MRGLPRPHHSAQGLVRGPRASREAGGAIGGTRRLAGGGCVNNGLIAMRACGSADLPRSWIAYISDQGTRNNNSSSIKGVTGANITDTQEPLSGRLGSHSEHLEVLQIDR